MKAIFIDAENARIEEISIERSLPEIYKQLGNGCELVEVAPFRGIELKQDDLLVDEEALLFEERQKFGFSYRGNVIYGNGLLVGRSGASWCNVRSTVEEITRVVNFYKAINK